MTAETAFCTSCGAVVGESWEFCQACGAEQPVEVSAVEREIGHPAEPRPGAAPTPVPAPRPLVGVSHRSPAATNLLVIGCLFTLAGIVYFFATSGFPPGITTTYEYHPDGSTSTSTSPDMIEGIVTVALLVIGGLCLRVSRAWRSTGAR